MHDYLEEGNIIYMIEEEEEDSFNEDDQFRLLFDHIDNINEEDEYCSFIPCEQVSYHFSY